MPDQTDGTANYDIQFFQLVISLHAAAMQQMGKIASPLTGKVERDLTSAKSSIDLLEMLERKTTGNLTDDEKKTLERTLYELRLNYVDELKKGDTTKKEPAETESAEQDTAQESEVVKPETDPGGSEEK